MNNILIKAKIIRLIIVLELLCPILGRCAERFAGRFTGEGLTLEAQGNQSNYTGTITLGENAFQFIASDKGDRLAGVFTTPDGPFDFHAALKGDKLTLTTGDTLYKLTRSNPLAKAKTGDGTGAKVTRFVRQNGSVLLGQFVSSVGDNKGKVGESATAAGFSTLASIGQQLGGASPQSPFQSGDPLLQVSRATTQPVTPPVVKSGSPSNRLSGIWIKTDQNVVDGTSSIRLTYAVLRSDGLMLMTANARKAGRFYNNQPNDSPQLATATETTESDVHARWASNNSILTISYDNGTAAQYNFEIRSGNAGLPVLRIQGGEGSAAQEWTKAN